MFPPEPLVSPAKKHKKGGAVAMMRQGLAPVPTREDLRDEEEDMRASDFAPVSPHGMRSMAQSTASSSEGHHVEDEDEPETSLESDIVWVIVVRGRQTSLALFATEWAGSLVSFSLIVNAGVPPGSAFLFFVNLVTFATAGIFLAPPFLKRMPARYRASARLRALVLFAVGWAAILSVLAFASAVVASREFVECRNLTYYGQCSRIQAAIAITFICSLALSGSFFVSFLGSVVPRDITVKTYIKGLAQAAAMRATSGRRAYGGEDSVPLNVLAPAFRSTNSSSNGTLSPIARTRSVELPTLTRTPPPVSPSNASVGIGGRLSFAAEHDTMDVMEIL